MGDTTEELTERFERYCNTQSHELPTDILDELQAMLRLYNISAEELDFKWQAYTMKMGAEETKLDLKNARDFRKNVKDTLDRESRGKAQQRSEQKRVAPTPRAGKGGDDVFGMYVQLSRGDGRGPVANSIQTRRIGSKHASHRWVEWCQWKHRQKEIQL